MDIQSEGDISTKTCVVVNENDEFQRIGSLEECHRRPCTLHRAFSVFVVDDNGKWLMTQRSKTKYTFPLVWTNATCSHPRDNASNMEFFIWKRMEEELGWAPRECPLIPLGRMRYSAASDHIWGEREITHAFLIRLPYGHETVSLKPDPSEVEDVKWRSKEAIDRSLDDVTTHLSPWFRALWTDVVHQSKSAARDDITHVGKLGVSIGGAESDCGSHAAPYSYLCAMRSKNIRPLVATLLAPHFGVSGTDLKTIERLVQGIHNGSLVADDIEDHSMRRRGAPCAHHLYGTPLSINAAYFGIFRHLEEMHGAPSGALRATVGAITDLHRGQGTDIQWVETAHIPTIDDYLRMVDGKTGALFRLIPILLGIYGGKLAVDSNTIVEKWSDACNDLSRFFQIRDDYANITDERYWASKGLYEDLDEGKMSYTAILCLQTQSEGAKRFKTLLLNTDARPHPIEDKLEAYEILFHNGALHETYSLLTEYYNDLRGRFGNDPVFDRLLVSAPLEPSAVRRMFTELHS